MKKINLKGISEILSEKELKNIVGGADKIKTTDEEPGTNNCTGKWEGALCKIVWSGGESWSSCGKDVNGNLKCK